MAKLPSSLTTVTLFSKILAGILFFTFIISAFFAGMIYQGKKDLSAYQQSNVITKPSSTPNPTANWKTYTNAKYGFEFKYPATHDIAAFGNNKVEISPAISVCLKGDCTFFSVNSYENKNNLSITDWLTNIRPDLYNAKTDSKQDIIINNYNAIKISRKFDVSYYLIHNSNINDIGFGYSSKLGAQILSTFKFTDQNQITPTSDEGKICGGIAGIICPTGYQCKYNNNYPDASGTCVK